MVEEDFNHDNFFRALTKKLDGEDVEINDQTQFVSLSNLLKEKFPEEKWLVDRFIPMGGLSCLSGLPGSYKTWLTHYFALCIVRGEKVFGKFPTQKTNVLFIDKENLDSWNQRRFIALGAKEDQEGCFFLRGNFMTESTDDLAKVVSFIKENGIGLTIIDSLVRIHGREENNAVEMNKVFQALKELQYAGSAVLFTHHQHKVLNPTGTIDVNNLLRGSSDILAVLDSHFSVNKVENYLQITQGKSRHDELIPPFLLEFDSKSQPFTFKFVKEIEGEGVKKAVGMDEIINFITVHESTTKEDVSMAFKEQFSERTVRRYLESLESEGRIQSYLVGHQKFYTVNQIKAFLSPQEDIL